MKKKFNITFLADNTALQPGFVARHGWAVWIEAGERRFLFDTGQGNEIVLNARTLNIDLAKCDTIILSHGHYDHTGGLINAIFLAPKTKVYAHPIAFKNKFAQNKDGTTRNNGMPRLCSEAIALNSTKIIQTINPTDLGSGLWVTGQIPRKTEFENSETPFFTDSQCSIPDPITDDQALFFKSADGLVIILGCAHAGIINTINYICELTGNNKVHAVIGGMHLLHASDERIQLTIEALKSINPDILGLAHCTGFAASKKLNAAFGKKCTRYCIGASHSF